MDRSLSLPPRLRPLLPPIHRHRRVGCGLSQAGLPWVGVRDCDVRLLVPVDHYTFCFLFLARHQALDGTSVTFSSTSSPPRSPSRLSTAEGPLVPFVGHSPTGTSRPGADVSDEVPGPRSVWGGTKHRPTLSTSSPSNGETRIVIKD